jgi:uncharacterized protein
MVPSRSLNGFGVGVREQLEAELLTGDWPIDWLEVTPEHWIDCGPRRRRVLDALGERWPLVPHSLSLSIGGPDPVSTRLIGEMARFCTRFEPTFWSDHLSYSQVDGVQANELLPLPYSEEAIERVATRAGFVRQRIDTRLVLENVTYYAEMPGSAKMPASAAAQAGAEATFLSAVLEASDCDLLLDVNNVYVNAVNFGRDPIAFLDQVPMSRVQMIHIAGHREREGLLIDTHEGPVPGPVWELYRHAIRRAGRVVPTLLEWDVEVPSLERVIREVEHARAHAAVALESR